jgi:hypothetical protein
MNTDPYQWQDYIVSRSRWTTDLGVTVLFIGILALSSMSFKLERATHDTGITTTSDVSAMRSLAHEPVADC